jgi:hypothetical protein
MHNLCRRRRHETTDSGWWARGGSNPRPKDYESSALTTELRARRVMRLGGKCPASSRAQSSQAHPSTPHAGEHTFDTRARLRYDSTMADYTSFEVELLRRSVGMLPPESPAGLSREKALQVLDQLRRLQEEQEHREQAKSEQRP